MKTCKDLQREILFGLVGYFDKENYLCMNPFYKQNEEVLQNNKILAQEIYPLIFRHFLSSWFEYYGTFENFCLDIKLSELQF